MKVQHICILFLPFFYARKEKCENKLCERMKGKNHFYCSLTAEMNVYF